MFCIDNVDVCHYYLRTVVKSISDLKIQFEFLAADTSADNKSVDV